MAMADLTAQRTLVKSPPELWTELSEVESLAKHLGELGEIRITKVEPESTVAWEGEEVSGTVELEQSGWGTKVTLTATVPEPDPAVAEPEPEPEPEEPRKQSFIARWLFRRRQPVEAPPEPVAIEPEPEQPEVEGPDVQRVFEGALDALGQAHHRPFSRG
jgi:hypothetical protein